eukprot:332384-Chlamydomonas_euryale.AAC.1
MVNATCTGGRDKTSFDLIPRLPRVARIISTSWHGCPTPEPSTLGPLHTPFHIHLQHVVRLGRQARLLQTLNARPKRVGVEGMQTCVG